MKIKHPIHGVGEVVRKSPSETFYICKYPTSNGGFYYRTHSSLSITRIEDE